MPLNDHSDSRRTAVMDLMKQFAQSTSCHGMQQIGSSNHKTFPRAIWIIIVVGLIGGMITALVSRIQEYLNYGTMIELHEKHSSQLDFPAVTICNMNRFFGINSILELETLHALVRASSPYKNEGKTNDWWNKEVAAYYENLRKQGKDRFFLSDKIHKRGWTLNETTLRACTFCNKPCQIQNFTRIVTSMGLCYSFTTSSKMIQNVPGSRNGLVVVLDINQREYTAHPIYDNPEAGVRVFIHNHHEPPLTQRFGISVPSGHAGHIVMRQTERKLLQPPWGNCSLKNKELNSGKKYTTSTCYKECGTQYVVEKCGCKPYWGVENHKITECDAWKILNCSGAAEAIFTTDYSLSRCGCHEPCAYLTFDASVSYSTFPSIEVGKFLKSATEFKEIEVLQAKSMNSNDSWLKVRHYRENHVMLDVYYDSLSYTRYIQKKEITETSLLSDIGGLLGLSLGISIATLVELCQLIFKVLTRALNCNKNRIHQDEYRDEELRRQTTEQR